MGENYLLPFPENLIRDVYLDSEYVDELLQNPQIRVNTLRAIHSILPNNQRMHYNCVIAIEDRYIAGATYKEIGEHIGVTGSRVRDILARGLRCLRHPKLLYVFRGQFVSVEDYDKFYENCTRGTSRTSVTREMILEMSLFEVMDLPIVKTDKRLHRMFNTIRREFGHITKISDLYEKEPEALMRVYRFGKISLESLVRFFNTYGIDYEHHHDLTKGETND